MAFSYDNIPFSETIGIDIIALDLYDPTATALSSTDLPIIAPILSDWSRVLLEIISEKTASPDYYQFSIYADLTSAEIIPEPTTLILLSTGILLLRKRKT